LTRIAAFGDSFAAGTRLPHDETWAAQLQVLRPDLDVVNFGVDGYGLGQSLLLDRRMRGRLDYEVSLYMFVPYHDPWRDANVIRYLGERWNSFTPMPRFVLEGDGIRLVPPFYSRGSEVYERDYPEASPELRAHLRAYDRFYVPALYEPAPFLSKFVLWKLIVARREQFTQKLTRREIGTDVDGEGFELSRRILKAAQVEGAAGGRRLLVVVLPVERDLENLAKLEKARNRWSRIVESLRAEGLETLDLAPALLAAPPGEIDQGRDGSHYGPKASAVIAKALAGWIPLYKSPNQTASAQRRGD
jgi:lysophospholipase L1-like esterase